MPVDPSTAATTMSLTNWLLQSLQVVLLLKTQCQLLEAGLTVKPDDLDAVVGRWNSNFTCVLDENSQSLYKASDINFTYQIGDSSTEKDVPSIYVRTINDWTIELRHFPEIDEIINCTVNFVFCNIKGRSTFWSKKVQVKMRKPNENPKIKNIYVENWETLSFAWDLKKNCQMHYNMLYKAWYWIDSTDAHPLECNNSQHGVCEIQDPFQVAFPGDMLIVKVNGSVRTEYSQGVLETVTSEEVRVNLNEFLRPKKINNIVVSQNQSTKILLFKPPKVNRNISYDINVNCTKPAFTKSKIITRLVTDHHRGTHSDRNSHTQAVREPFVGLPPYSNCTVSVRAISVTGGNWSEWAYHDFQTLQDVPLAAPRLCKGCFQVKETSNNALFQVIIYFTPLSDEKARGRVELYRIKIINNGASVIVKELNSDPLYLSSFLISNLSIDNDYEITIEAKTEIGYNETLDLSSSTILMPQSKHRPNSHSNDEFIVLVLNETAVRTTWEMKESSGIDKMSLFWCKGKVESSRPCQDILRWKEFPITSTEPAVNITHVINLDEDNSIHDFIVGTGIERDGKTRGIRWNSCTYDIRSSPPKPRVEYHNKTSSGVSISLLEHSCGNTDNDRGFIIGHRLFFCPINSSDDHKCLEEMKSQEFHGRHQVLNLNDLSHNQTYLIAISSFSETKISDNVTIRATTLAVKESDNSTVWIVLGSIIGIVSVFAAVAFVPLKGEPIWKHFKDFPILDKVVVPHSRRIHDDNGCLRNGNGGTESETLAVVTPLLCSDSSDLQYIFNVDVPGTLIGSHSVDVHDTCNSPDSVDVTVACIGPDSADVPVAFNGPPNVDVPDTCNDGPDSVDAPVAINSPANADVPVDPSTLNISIIAEVSIEVDVQINVKAPVSVMPSLCTDTSSLDSRFSLSTSHEDCSNRILPCLTATIKASMDSLQDQLQPHAPALKVPSSLSVWDRLDADDYYPGNSTNQPTYDKALCGKPSNIDEGYVDGSAHVCTVFLPVPCEPARPVTLDSGSGFSAGGNGSEAQDAMRTESYYSSVARNEDTSSGTGYHSSKVSPSRSAESVCEKTGNDNDYPPMRIIEMDFYDDSGKLEKKPSSYDDVRISTDVMVISNDVALTTDFNISDDVTVSIGDVISAGVIASPDVMTTSDDRCSKGVLLAVCGDYDPDEDCVYSTVVDVNVTSRADGPILPVPGGEEMDDGYTSGGQVLGNLSLSPKTPDYEGSEGGLWPTRHEVQDQRCNEWSVDSVSLYQSSSILPWPLNLHPTGAELIPERVLPSILPPCV